VSSVLVSLLHSLWFMVCSRASLHLEIVPLRHQLAVVNRSKRPRLGFTSADRMWAWLSQAWRGWRSAVHIVTPDSVIAWHRRGVRLFWTWQSRHRVGRPPVPDDIRALIREMSTANPLWGAPRIHGELQTHAGLDFATVNRCACTSSVNAWPTGAFVFLEGLYSSAKR
jgi:hypothetical protein